MNPELAPAPLRPCRWPISRVLILFYTSSSVAILLLISAFLYWVTASNLEKDDEHFLLDQIEILRLILREKPNDLEALKNEVQFEGVARRYARYYARVLDEQRSVIVQDEEMDRALPKPDDFPEANTDLEGDPRFIKRESSDGHFFLLASTYGPVGPTGQSKRLLQLALDITSNEQVLIKYRRLLIGALAIGMGFLTGLGIVIARGAMRPLAEITEAIQRITASHLHERIAPGRWPRELVSLASAFDEMLNRLEGSFTRLSQFSADLAHELRTPLASLRGEAELALTRDRSQAEYRRILESSLEEYGRLAGVIDSLLFLARAENAETVLSYSQFDPVRETHKVVSFFEAMLAERQLKAEVLGEGRLEADLSLFKRALFNLVANAVKHTPAGGTITVSVNQGSNGEFRVTVEDTGRGISSEHLDRIFDRFYRVDKSRSETGAGLGLPIVKSIMQLHRGSVHVHSQVDVGTSFTLMFPNAPTQAK